MTLEDLRCLPQFVKADPDVATAIQDYFPEEIKTRIRRRPKTAVERLSPFDLSAELPASADDPYVVAMEHAVNSLLINDTADYSDAIFPAILRERNDFQQLRSQAWLEAIRTQPPLWYALPLELKDQAEFHPIEGEVARIDLDAWESKVRQTPWLLTQAKGVPKSIRHHTRILNAYIDGWLPFFESAPWKVWCKRGLGRRVYASYGILGDPRVFDALVKGWTYFRGKAKLDAAWFSGSIRMREMPVFQLSALMTIGDDARAEYVGKQVRVTCEDIASKQDQSLSIKELSAVQKEVRQRLLAMGFMN
jgi:hypothetical protein